jgi:hypothetical protein
MADNKALLDQHQRLFKDWSRIYVKTHTWKPQPLFSDERTQDVKFKDSPSMEGDIVRLKELFREIGNLKHQGGFDETNTEGQARVSTLLSECETLLEVRKEMEKQESEQYEMGSRDSSGTPGL